MKKTYVKFEESIDKKSTIFNLIIDPVINRSCSIIVRATYETGNYNWFQITHQSNHKFVFGAPKIILTSQSGVQRFFEGSGNLAIFFDIGSYFVDAYEISVFQLDPYDIYSINDILSPLAKDIFGYCDTTFVASLDTANLVGVLNFGIGNVVVKIDYKNGFVDIYKSDSIKEKSESEVDIDCQAYFKDSSMTIADFYNLFLAIDEKYQLPNEI